MKLLLRLSGILGAILSTLVTVQAQPANDNFANRIPLTGPAVTTTGSNVGAGTEGREPTGGFFGYGSTVWWSWTAPIAGPVTINTFGSDFNTTLGVYTGTSVSALSSIAYTDDAPGYSGVSLVSFTAQQGTEYQIQVGGARAFMFPPPPPASGNIQLNIGMPPSVTITSPANGSRFTVGSNFLCSASVSSPVAPVAQVEFYSSSRLLGTTPTEPYEVLVSNALPGSNSIYAVVMDTLNQRATSAVVSILITSLDLTVISPPDGAMFMYGSAVNFAVYNALPTGVMTNVEFFANGEKIGEDRSAPLRVFNTIWSSATGGSFRLTALGKDNTGKLYKPRPISIGVTSPVVARGSVWKYLDNGSDQGTDWIMPDFDDSSWASGPAELGYGDGDEATIVSFGPDPFNRYITTYLRHAFTLTDPASYTSLRINVKRDDGAVVYLNGVQLARFNMGSGPITYTTLASTAQDDGANLYSANVPLNRLVKGVNVFAVEVHQNSPFNDDMSFDMELVAVPVIIGNRTPDVALTSPTDGQFFFSPASLALTATASDIDGTVTKVQFFQGNTKLAEFTNSPYALTLNDLPAGVYTFTAVATDELDGIGTSTPVTVTVYDPASRWVAYNDHYAGPNTHPNATAWNAFGTEGGAPGDEGPLRNIATGASLTATLTIIELGAMGDTDCGAPPPGTPAYDTFNSVVDFGSGKVNHAILVDDEALVLHLFTGLDPNRRYNFRATAVGGVPAHSNRWTRFTISGVTVFTPAHTANVLTSTEQPDALNPDEAAMNTGDNSSGDMVGWDNIVPGPDGSFLVVSTQYLGPAPGNRIPGPFAYAPVAVRLEEVGAQPFVQVTDPPDGYVVEGPIDLPVSALATAVDGVANVLFLANGSVIGSASAPPYNIIWDNTPFGTHTLAAVAFDTEGFSSTSAPVSVTITIPPTNTVAPILLGQDPSAGATITSLTTIHVTFSERVIGVDAADLLVNDLPATGVSGTGSNYTFTVTQPAYGPVLVRWASGHGITDVGWPWNLPFDESAPAASWTYELIDRTPPTIAAKIPPAGASVTGLTQVSVTFSEAVTGVSARDLLVNGVPAYAVSGAVNNYTFNVSQPSSGTVSISWATDHGITDLADSLNAFNPASPGATWNFTLDARTTLVESNSYWMFLKGTADASAPMDAWRQLGFDDSAWTLSPAPFFFGDPYSNGVPAYTLLDDMLGNYTSIYLRQTFLLPDMNGITNLILRAQSDDGFIAWINGVEVVRYNMPVGEIYYDGTASSAAPEPSQRGAAYINYTLRNADAYLVPGSNVLAVHAFNQSLAQSTDFGFNAQLYTYLTDTEVVTPRVVGKDPAAGYTLFLTNITVTFSEPVTNVDATDLLINGTPAAELISATNTTFTFSFPQPPYGVVSITWATDHGIVDLDLVPKPFDDLLPDSTWQYTLLNPNSPYLLSVVPTRNTTVTQLTQVELTFSEPVTGVNASDLLVNNTPATAMIGSGSNYTFTFPHPAYGSVSIGWATNHGIKDLDVPSNDFDPTWPNHTWTYYLADQTPPTIASQTPAAGSAVLNLTQIQVVFTEPVRNVNASDLLINGKAAVSMSGTNTTYTFTFPQPNTTNIQVTWATGHGITDQASPTANAFDATGPGATWSYSTVDNVRPTLVSVFPAPYSTIRSTRKITLMFDEPVVGLNLESLTVDTEPALTLTGSGAGPYVFEVGQSLPGTVQVILSSEVWDLASPRNQFLGSNWTYVVNPDLPPPSITRGPYLQIRTTNSIVIRWRTSEATDSLVQYGLEADSRTNFVTDAAYTNEHIVTLPNLTIDTRYVYAIGTSDDLLFTSTNYYFSTAPPIGVSRPTRVWFVSDYGTRDSNEQAVRDALLNFTQDRPPDVWITGGDNDQTDGQDSNYSVSVFGEQYGYGNVLQHQAMWPTPGNHDYQSSQGQSFYANFSMPINGEAGGVPSGSQHYYSFDYADIHFVCLNAIESSDSVSTNTAMFQWLRQDLASNTQRWLIAYWHGPPYSKGTHDSDSTTDTLSWMVRMREYALPILESYGVDLVLCGHSHVYERSWLLNGHYGYSSTFSETNKIDAGDGRVDGDGAYLKPPGQEIGAVYVVAALGGRPQSGSGSRHPAHLMRMDQLLGTCVIDVNSNQLDFRFLGSTTEPYTDFGILDHFTISKDPQIAPPATPLELMASIAGNQIQLSWSNTPTNEMGYKLERSTDGLNFVQITTVGANRTSYTDTAVPPGATLFYRIRAWNDQGDSAYSDIEQAIEYKAPKIVQQPQSATVTTGSDVTFTVVAEGTEPLTYQWLFNGDDAVPGGTNSTLTLHDVQIGQAGFYTVVVINRVGAATSSMAWLTLLSEATVSLTISRSGEVITLSWPADTDGYELEGASALAPSAQWQTITEGIITEGTRKSLQFTPDPGQPMGFFRLRKP
jgi:hypothetical protein